MNFIKFIQATILKFNKNHFIFEELVKRDFKQKYKRTVLGMLWSLLSPMLTLLVMKTVFTQFFGRHMPHYTTYIFSGTIIYNYYREATSGGMNALMSNAGILTKVNVPKYLFVLSKNVSAAFNYSLTLIIYFLFAALDHVPFRWSFLLLIYPICCLIVFNIGFGMILSALFVFFRDIQYLHDIFSLMLMYLSAIFYYIDQFPQNIQNLFMLNPLYCYISYFRTIVIDGTIPTLNHHLLALLYAVLFLFAGGMIYHKKNQQFLYYM